MGKCFPSRPNPGVVILEISCEQGIPTFPTLADPEADQKLIRSSWPRLVFTSEMRQQSQLSQLWKQEQLSQLTEKNLLRDAMETRERQLSFLPQVWQADGRQMEQKPVCSCFAVPFCILAIRTIQCAALSPFGQSFCKYMSEKSANRCRNGSSQPINSHNLVLMKMPSPQTPQEELEDA